MRQFLLCGAAMALALLSGCSQPGGTAGATGAVGGDSAFSPLPDFSGGGVSLAGDAGVSGFGCSAPGDFGDAAFSFLVDGSAIWTSVRKCHGKFGSSVEGPCTGGSTPR